jgi:hypothetical protein
LYLLGHVCSNNPCAVHSLTFFLQNLCVKWPKNENSKHKIRSVIISQYFFNYLHIYFPIDLFERFKSYVFRILDRICNSIINVWTSTVFIIKKSSWCKMVKNVMDVIWLYKRCRLFYFRYSYA